MSEDIEQLKADLAVHIYKIADALPDSVVVSLNDLMWEISDTMLGAEK